MAIFIDQTEETSPMGRVERSREIARRRSRRAKLTKLRKAYAEAKTESEKTDIQEKVRKLSPLVTLD
ncbi:MAG: hypothetical protein KDA93_12850 [Planctomycetaceae bacterium]|nr:hypothetical protein [Planctomycetaceae bacterium]